jgi:hypothetical protein
MSSYVSAQSIYYDALLCGKIKQEDLKAIIDANDRYGITLGEKEAL